MGLTEGSKCPKCGIGMMEEEKIKVDEKSQIVKGKKVTVRKYALYLSCDFCDNRISQGKTRYE